MSQILLLRKVSGIIGWMKPMYFFASLFPLRYSFIYMVWPIQSKYGPNLSLFGVQDELRVHQLEIELFSMSPSSFDSIKGLFIKFKSLVQILKNYGIEKKYDQLILSILSKLGLEYLDFVSTFHVTTLVVSNWKMPSLCMYISHLWGFIIFSKSIFMILISCLQYN